MNQQQDNTTQNDQQPSWYYDIYSNSNFLQQPHDQDQQSGEQQAGHSDQQASWYFDSHASYNNCHNSNYEQQQQQQQQQRQQQRPITQSHERATRYLNANPSNVYQECHRTQQQRRDPRSYYYHNGCVNNNYNVFQNQDRASWYNQQQIVENPTAYDTITTLPSPSSAVATPIPPMIHLVTSNNGENKTEKQGNILHDRSPLRPTDTEMNSIGTNDIGESSQHWSAAAPALSKDSETMMLLDDGEYSMVSVSDDESDGDNNNDNTHGMQESEDNEYEDEDEDDWMNDSDSVASYNTASDEPTGFVEDDEDDEDNENNGTLLSDIQSSTGKIEWKMKEHFMNLIKEFGEEPGMSHMEGTLKQHDIKLPGATNVFFEKPGAVNWTIELVKKFSKVDISIYTYKRPYTMKLTGTPNQCHYAIKAMDAILLDYVRSKSIYVLLRLDGPRFKEQAKNIINVLSKLVPDEERITEVEGLHVTVARPEVGTDADYDRLIDVIKEAGMELEEALKEDHFIGRFNAIYDISPGYLGASPERKETDPIGVIRTVIQKKLKAAQLINSVREIGQKMHMTLYLSGRQERGFRNGTLLTKEKFEKELAAQGLEFDYGPMIVTKIEVSRRAISLASSLRYVYDFVYDV